MPVELRDDELADARKLREEAGLGNRSLFTTSDDSVPIPIPIELAPPKDEPIEKSRREAARDGGMIVEEDDNGLLRAWVPGHPLAGEGIRVLSEARA